MAMSLERVLVPCFKDGPVGLLVESPFEGSFCVGSKIQLQKHRLMVTSTRLLSYLSSDAPMQILGAERYVWSRCGVTSSGAECGLVWGAVDQEQTVLILLALHFFTSSIMCWYTQFCEWLLKSPTMKKLKTSVLTISRDRGLSLWQIGFDTQNLPCDCLSERHWCCFWQESILFLCFCLFCLTWSTGSLSLGRIC